MNEKVAIKVWVGETEGTALGTVWAAVSEKGLWAVDFGVTRQTFERNVRRRGRAEIIYDTKRVEEPLRQLSQYLAGERKDFDLEIDWSGMRQFEAEARQAVFAIPYGATRSYGEIAKQLGEPGAARAVGRANATNPMPLVIPCHRVLGADGSLTGYGGKGGLKTKAWLLKLEGARLV